MSHLLAIAEARATPYALAFESPIVTAHGRFTHRRGWLLSVVDTEGRVGWGDAAPWPGFGSTDEQVSLQIGGLTDGRLVGMAIGELPEIASDVARRKLTPEVSHALELALLDLLGQRRAQPLAALLTETDAPTTAQTHTLVIGDPDPRSRWLKVKIHAQPLATIEARLARIIAQAHNDARLRLDVGGAWTKTEAAEAIPRLARYRVHTIEQPIAMGHVEELAVLRVIANRHGVALAADEDVTGAGALDALLAADAVDEIVIKPMFVGGLITARRLASVAHAAGCRATVTNALESGIGRAGARHLAAVIAGVHGLSDALAEDVVTLPPRCENRVSLPAGHGLGVQPQTAGGESTAAHIPHPLCSSSIAQPRRAAIVTRSQTWSYRELNMAAAARGFALHARGVGPGARVAFAGPRDVRWVAWLHGIGRVGAVAVPLPDRATAAELEHIQAATRPDLVIDTTCPVPEGDLPERFWPLDEPRVVLCSSGSTAAPRPVALTTLQLTTSAFGSAIVLGHQHDDRWLCCLPLHHVGGLSILYRCAFYATTVVLHERFVADRVARALDDGDATLVSLVPNMLTRVLDARLDRWGHERTFPGSLRAILLGGAKAPDELLARCEALRAPIALTWGMTEAASQVATSSPGEDRLVPHAFSRVAARDGRLVVRGPVVAHGELVSSDAGTVTAEGEVRVVGRADDVIISGGEKVAPAEIERVLRRHPDIDDVAVVARACSRWGRRPYAVLETRQDLSPEALTQWCREHLTAFKVPDGFVCVRTLPRAELGKIALREIHRLLDAQLPEKLRDDAQPRCSSLRSQESTPVLSGKATQP